MPLRLKVKGATKEELARGVDAAVAFLKTEGVTPQQAYDGAWARHCNDIDGFPEDDPNFGPQKQQWARLWDKANRVAIKACCDGWDEVPLYGELDIYPHNPPLH
jgi:hypothetical protein